MTLRVHGHGHAPDIAATSEDGSSAPVRTSSSSPTSEAPSAPARGGRTSSSRETVMSGIGGRGGASDARMGGYLAAYGKLATRLRAAAGGPKLDGEQKKAVAGLLKDLDKMYASKKTRFANVPDNEQALLMGFQQAAKLAGLASSPEAKAWARSYMARAEAMNSGG